MDTRKIMRDEESKIVKSINFLENLKSDYFLKGMFNIMKERKSLEIIKLNKKLQKRLNININNYQKYCQLYSSIEIVLKPAENIYGKFIKISNEVEEYYHIYFDNSNKEIKRTYIKENEKVKNIKIIIDYQVESFKELFMDCHCIDSIFFKKFFRINITNMSWMFGWCLTLKEINLSNFNTSNVTNMSYMFYACSSLTELNLSTFNTNNVIDMCSMFDECSSLKKINLDSFNTNNVTNMSFMFHRCSSLNELNLSNFNTNNLLDKDCMLFECSDELIEKIKKQNKNLIN